MRIKVQVGKRDVDIGKRLEDGLNELHRIRRQAADGLKRLRVPTEEAVVTGINNVTTSLWGYQFVPVKPPIPAAVFSAPAAPRPRRSAPPKRRPHQKKRR